MSKQTEIEINTYRVTVNYIAANGVVRSSALAMDAPDAATASKNALMVAEQQGWKKPRVTKIAQW